MWIVVSKNIVGCNKLLKYGLVPKLYLVCLFMTLNAVDKAFIEKSRMVCLALLPLMFQDPKFREQV